MTPLSWAILSSRDPPKTHPSGHLLAHNRLTLYRITHDLLLQRHPPYRTPVPYTRPPVRGHYLYVPKYVPVNTRRYLRYRQARQYIYNRRYNNGYTENNFITRRPQSCRDPQSQIRVAGFWPLQQFLAAGGDKPTGRGTLRGSLCTRTSPARARR